jgi:hypothetical protein
MSLYEVLDGLSCLSVTVVKVAIRRPSQLRQYISHCLKRYDEVVGNGLPARSPVTPSPDLTVTIPAYHTGGGMGFDELVILARAVRVLKPKTVFEIGSYNGLSTAVFILNSEADTRVITLDLPRDWDGSAVISSDDKLVATRELVSVPLALGLSRASQILCDSMQFDPSPYANSVDLGLIDAAHDVTHVKNDTVKMATMMADEGIVFWHDYGGKGPLRPLAAYLEALAKRCPLYRIRGTSLAWGAAGELKKALLCERDRQNPCTP